MAGSCVPLSVGLLFSECPRPWHAGGPLPTFGGCGCCGVSDLVSFGPHRRQAVSTGWLPCWHPSGLRGSPGPAVPDTSLADPSSAP